MWSWVLIPVLLIGMLIGLLVTPVFALLQLVGFRKLSIGGNDARVTKDGIEVFSRQRCRIGTYECAAISQLRRKFDPPIRYGELLLANGDVISLHIARLNPSDFRAHNIPIDEKSI